jgi:glucose/arabinose dehydrogenase/mono/diheme cytochrome c family protein
MNRLTVFVGLAALGAARLFAAENLPVPDADNGGLHLPPGFRALIVADNLIAGRKIGNDGDQLRFLAVATNGDLYAKTVRGGIIALRDANGDGRFEEKQEFGSGGGTGIALHDGWLYHSSNSAVFRYRLTPGELVPAGQPETIISGLVDTGTHNAKTFAFDDQGRLLVEVGSPYNVYSEPDRSFGAKGMDATEFLKGHGGFWRFDPNRLNQTLADGFHFSTGHRHSIALAWQPTAKEFFMVMMGRDQMNVVAPDYYDDLDNAERVSEEMHRLREGTNIGWPYTYWDPIKKARMVAPEFGGDNRKRAEVGKYDEPVIAFPAHWAPLQMAFYTGNQFPAPYRGGAFVAFHGSWNRAPLPQDGYNISFVPFDEKGAPEGKYEVFASNAGPQRFRMGGVAVGPDGSLYVSETDRGRIWRIIYTGETGGASNTAMGVVEKHAPVDLKADKMPGKMGFTLFCAPCHMVDGSGAGQLQPPLAGSPVVAGDVSQLIRVVLQGPAVVLPADRAKYSNVMPPFAGVLNDQQIAEVLTYIRQVFGAGAKPVSTEQVAVQRTSLH